MTQIRTKIKIVQQVFPKDNDVLQQSNPYRIFNCSPTELDSGLKLNNNLRFSIKGELSHLDVSGVYDVLLLEKETNQWSTTYEVIETYNFSDFANASREEQEVLLAKIASPANIKTLLDNYPNFISDMLTYGKEHFDLRRLKKIKKKKIQAYERLLREKFQYYHIIQANRKWNINNSDCKLLLQEYNNDVKISQAFDSDPYGVLINVLGRSFLTQDDLVLTNAPEHKETERRCEFLMLEILKHNEIENGSTKMTTSLLTYKFVDYAPELKHLAKKVASNSPLIHYDEENKVMGVQDTYSKELFIYGVLTNLIAYNNKLDLDWKQFSQTKDGSFLTEEQQQVLKSFCDNRLTVLDAAGGTGKTTTISALLDMLDNYGIHYTCLAPTGLAAKVFRNSTNRRCSTIHRCKLKDRGTSAEVVIVDEYSMLGVELTNMLFECIHNMENVRIVLLGDLGQLEPIQPMSLAYELNQCKSIHKVRLTKVFRYKEGGASKVSSNTRNGLTYIEPQDMDKEHFTYGTKKDYEFYQSDGSIEQIVDVYEHVMNTHNAKPSDIAVLSLYNVKSLGTYNINNAIQEVVNPSRGEEEMTIKKGNISITFRKGSLVLNTKNNYQCMTLEIYQALEKDPTLSIEEFEDDVVEIINGDIGTVLHVDKNALHIQFDEDIVVFTKNACYNLLLAYSLGYHKSQGSSFQYVINVVANEHYANLTRQALYVAQTRQRKALIEIGDHEAIDKAIRTNEISLRHTFLNDMLKSYDSALELVQQ